MKRSHSTVKCYGIENDESLIESKLIAESKNNEGICTIRLFDSLWTFQSEF